MLRVVVETLDGVVHSIRDVRYVTYTDKYIIVQHDISKESKSVFPQRFVKYVTTDPM